MLSAGWYSPADGLCSVQIFSMSDHHFCSLHKLRCDKQSGCWQLNTDLLISDAFAIVARRYSCSTPLSVAYDWCAPLCLQLTQELMLSRLLGVPTESSAGSGLSSRQGQAATTPAGAAVSGSHLGASSAARVVGHSQPSGVCIVGAVVVARSTLLLARMEKYVL